MADQAPPEQPIEQPPSEQTTEQASAAAPDVSMAVPAAMGTGYPQVDLNGSAEIPQIDPTTIMNGFPINPDPNFMAGQIDPMQAGIMPMMPEMQSITADEIALYDRQIRLWGVKAQERIRSANILLIGMKALGNEIAKNLVLAGVGTLTILDHELVSEEDLGSQFFVSQEQVGQNRAQAAQVELQKLNPRVQLFIDPDIVYTKMPEYFSSFDITIATGLPLEALTSINMSCRNYNRKFYAADTHGMYGHIFVDLFIHQFVVEKAKSNKATKPGEAETSMRLILSVTEAKDSNKIMETVTKQESYSPLLLVNSSPLPKDITKFISRRKKVTPLLSCIRALFDFQKASPEGRLPQHNRADLELFTRLATEKHLELELPIETLKAEFLRSFLQNLGSELSPVVAFLGGALSQDVINVLGQREQPLQNFLLFDGELMQSTIYAIHPDLEAFGMNLSTDAHVAMNGNFADMGAEINGMTNGVMT